MSIRLSEKHGVNPSMGICFWCGKDNGSLYLLGKLPGDKEAPRRCLYDYTPCDKCQTEMDKGITIVVIEPESSFENQPEIQEGFYPTGSWSVVTQEFVKKLVKDEELKRDILLKRKFFIDSETASHLGLVPKTE